MAQVSKSHQKISQLRKRNLCIVCKRCPTVALIRVARVDAISDSRVGISQSCTPPNVAGSDLIQISAHNQPMHGLAEVRKSHRCLQPEITFEGGVVLLDERLV